MQILFTGQTAVITGTRLKNRDFQRRNSAAFAVLSRKKYIVSEGQTNRFLNISITAHPKNWIIFEPVETQSNAR